jgi:acyl carrier protein
MTERSVVLERLRALFFQHFHVEVPSVAMDLLESGVLDSLQLVDLLLLIEENFGRRIPIEAVELDDLRSLERLATLVSTLPGGVGAAPVSPAIDAGHQPEPTRGEGAGGKHELNRRG